MVSFRLTISCQFWGVSIAMRARRPTQSCVRLPSRAVPWESRYLNQFPFDQFTISFFSFAPHISTALCELVCAGVLSGIFFVRGDSARRVRICARRFSVYRPITFHRE